MSIHFPRWIDEDESVFLREVAPRLYVGARDAGKSRQWGLVIDLHGTPHHTSRSVITWQFHDGLPFPDNALTDIVKHIDFELFSGRRTDDVLIVCEVGRSRSASCAYAMLRRLYDLDDEEAYSRITTSTSFQAGPKVLTVDWPRERTLKSARAWVENGVP